MRCSLGVQPPSDVKEIDNFNKLSSVMLSTDKKYMCQPLGVTANGSIVRVTLQTLGGTYAQFVASAFIVVWWLPWSILYTVKSWQNKKWWYGSCKGVILHSTYFVLKDKSVIYTSWPGVSFRKCLYCMKLHTVVRNANIRISSFV